MRDRGDEAFGFVRRSACAALGSRSEPPTSVKRCRRQLRQDDFAIDNFERKNGMDSTKSRHVGLNPWLGVPASGAKGRTSRTPYETEDLVSAVSHYGEWEVH